MGVLCPGLLVRRTASQQRFDAALERAQLCVKEFWAVIDNYGHAVTDADFEREADELEDLCRLHEQAWWEREAQCWKGL